MWNASLLITLSAFCHALWNALAKNSPAPSIQVWGVVTFSAIFALGFIPFFDGPSFPNRASLVWAIASGFFEAGYMLTLATTLTRSPMGASYTVMRGGAMVLVWVISSLFLDEKINGPVLTGIALVMAGLYLTSNRGKSAVQATRVTPWAYACAVCVAGYHLCYGRSLESGANAASLFALSLWIAAPALFIYNGKKRLPELSHQFFAAPKLMMFAGFVSTISFLLFLVGLRHAEAGMALTLRNTSVIFAQIFALLIGEKFRPMQWVGAVLVAGGAALVQWNTG